MNTQRLVERRGLMLILSSPSGAGKTTLARALLQADPNLTMSVSLTTRKRRPGEVHGSDYYFVTPAEFEQHVADGKLLEYAKVFDHYYGTPKDAVDKALSTGKDVLFDIDWQGTQQLSQMARGDLVSVFILPPNLHELEERLTRRAQDPQEVVARRMAKAQDEISHWAEYDYVIINAEFEKALAEIKAILAAERLRRQRQTGLSTFVKNLVQGI
ncbi:MAG: guanylate kinase [Holosporales bacterium]